MASLEMNKNWKICSKRIQAPNILLPEIYDMRKMDKKYEDHKTTKIDTEVKILADLE